MKLNSGGNTVFMHDPKNRQKGIRDQGFMDDLSMLKEQAYKPCTADARSWGN